MPPTAAVDHTDLGLVGSASATSMKPLNACTVFCETNSQEHDPAVGAGLSLGVERLDFLPARRPSPCGRPDGRSCLRDTGRPGSFYYSPVPRSVSGTRAEVSCCTFGPGDLGLAAGLDAAAAFPPRRMDRGRLVVLPLDAEGTRPRTSRASSSAFSLVGQFMPGLVEHLDAFRATDGTRFLSDREDQQPLIGLTFLQHRWTSKCRRLGSQ